MSSIVANIIVIVAVGCIVAAILYYLYKSKKRGDGCIGCPYAKQCGGNCHSENSSQQNRHR